MHIQLQRLFPHDFVNCLHGSRVSICSFIFNYGQWFLCCIYIYTSFQRLYRLASTERIYSKKRLRTQHPRIKLTWNQYKIPRTWSIWIIFPGDAIIGFVLLAIGEIPQLRKSIKIHDPLDRTRPNHRYWNTLADLVFASTHFGAAVPKISSSEFIAPQLWTST